jgi:hypothetical protein
MKLLQFDKRKGTNVGNFYMIEYFQNKVLYISHDTMIMTQRLQHSLKLLGSFVLHNHL